MKRLFVPAVLILSGLLIVAAMRQSSATFDEIVLIAAGARGYETGRFDMTPDHPPLMQYAYGLPAFLARPTYPPESLGWSESNRYAYAQTFFWGSGNDPEALAFSSRLFGAACAVLLALAVYMFTRRRVNERAALIALVLIAFLPDLLGHGGVAYNDVPHTLSFFVALWLIDAAARAPTPRRGALAGAAFALALGIKFSALLIGPVALLIIVAEAYRQRTVREWRRRLPAALLAATAAAYVLTVLIYRFDPSLEGLRTGIAQQLVHVGEGHHGAPAYLLGRKSTAGFWYFYPVAFVFKTPAALHILIVLAVAGAWLAHRETHDTARGDARGPLRVSIDALCSAPIRPMLFGAMVVAPVLVTTRLNIGFRHAMPALPLLIVIVAAGVDRRLRDANVRTRRLVPALLGLYVLSALFAYPNFLAYTSEYIPQSRAYEYIADSSLDWGQGLLALRDDQRAHNGRRVYLSYFGSAIPGGYGIRYRPLPSFAALPPQPERPGEPEPQDVVISATNLAGIYLPSDPFARFRSMKPDRIVARTLYVFRLHD